MLNLNGQNYNQISLQVKLRNHTRQVSFQSSCPFTIRPRMGLSTSINLTHGRNHLLRDPETSRLELMCSNAEIYPLLIVMVNQIHTFAYGILVRLFNKPDSLRIMLIHSIMKLLNQFMKQIKLRIYLLSYLMSMIKISILQILMTLYAELQFQLKMQLVQQRKMRFQDLNGTSAG